MAEQYSFITHWRIKAPLQDVWNAIYLSEEWPNWWKGVVSVVETVKGDERGIGSIRIYKLRSPMAYTLSFKLELTERIDQQLLKGTATGELAGTGSWHFAEEPGNITHISCHWNVHTTVRWMNTFAFLLRPLFTYNHNAVMRQGAQSLAKKLRTELISFS